MGIFNLEYINETKSEMTFKNRIGEIDKQKSIVGKRKSNPSNNGGFELDIGKTLPKGNSDFHRMMDDSHRAEKPMKNANDYKFREKYYSDGLNQNQMQKNKDTERINKSIDRHNKKQLKEACESIINILDETSLDELRAKRKELNNRANKTIDNADKLANKSREYADKIHKAGIAGKIAKFDKED